MRETRTSGSEGGGTLIRPPYPYPLSRLDNVARSSVQWSWIRPEIAARLPSRRWPGEQAGRTVQDRGSVMATVNEGYVVDVDGARVGVILPIEDCRKLLEELEELESIRACHAAKRSGDEAIPFEQAAREIEQDRRWLLRSRTM